MLKELYLDASESRNPHWMPIPFGEDQRMRFRDWDAEDAFKVPVTLTASDANHIKHRIAVKLRGFESLGPVPISGFPATLAELQDRCNDYRLP